MTDAFADTTANTPATAPSEGYVAAPKAAPLDAQAMELLEMFTYMQQKINDHLEKVFAVDNLSLAHYRALFFVMRYPGMTVGGLIDKLDITKQSLARVLTELMRVKDESEETTAASDGYIYALVDSADRRVRRLYLTNKGAALMDEALRPVATALKDSFSVNNIMQKMNGEARK